MKKIKIKSLSLLFRPIVSMSLVLAISLPILASVNSPNRAICDKSNAKCVTEGLNPTCSTGSNRLCTQKDNDSEPLCINGSTKKITIAKCGTPDPESIGRCESRVALCSSGVEFMCDDSSDRVWCSKLDNGSEPLCLNIGLGRIRGGECKICPNICKLSPWENNQICNLSKNFFQPNSYLPRISPTLNSFDIMGNIGYFSNSSFDVLNLTDPLNPQTLSSVGSDYTAVKTDNQYAYLIDLNSMFGRINISNPQNLNFELIDNVGTARDLLVDNNKVYVPIPNVGLKVYSSTSKVLSNIYLNGNEVVNVTNNFAYVVDGLTLDIYDVTNPLNSIKKSSSNHEIYIGSGVPYYGEPVQIILRDRYLYILLIDEHFVVNPGIHGTYVLIYDVSNPSSPVKVSSTKLTDDINLKPAFDISGNYLYLFSPSQRKIDVVNISNLSSLKKITSLNSVGALGKIKVSGNYAFLFNRDQSVIYHIAGCGVSTSSSSSSSSGAICNPSCSNEKVCCDGTQLKCPDDFPNFTCSIGNKPQCCSIQGGLGCNDSLARCEQSTDNDCFSCDGILQIPTCCNNAVPTCPQGQSIHCGNGRCCKFNLDGTVTCFGDVQCGNSN